MKKFILLWNIIQVSRNQDMDIFGTSAWNMDIFGISSSLNLKMSSSKGKASSYNTNHVEKMWAWGTLALFKVNTGSDFSHFRRRSTAQIPTKNSLISNTKLHLHWDSVLLGVMQTERISISWVCKPIFIISVSIGNKFHGPCKMCVLYQNHAFRDVNTLYWLFYRNMRI